MAADLINTGLNIVEKPSVILPAEIGRLMLSIQQLIPNSGLEYGVFLKGVWNPNKVCVEVDKDAYYFPKQTASSGHIQFHEDGPGPEYNVVIHRHPSGVRGFSGTDKNSINQEFLASILFIPPWDFPAAVVNIPIARGTKLHQEATIKITGSAFEASPELRAAVKERFTEYSSASLTKEFKPTMANSGATAKATMTKLPDEGRKGLRRLPLFGQKMNPRFVDELDELGLTEEDLVDVRTNRYAGPDRLGLGWKDGE
jgi:hypothetical protein